MRDIERRIQRYRHDLALKSMSGVVGIESRFQPAAGTGGCRSAGVAWATLTLAMMLTGAASAQVLREEFPTTDGAIYAMQLSADTLYIGGAFTVVGPVTGSAIPLHPVSGVPRTGYPRVVGLVNAVIPDGSGGWFIGGRFTSVGGLPRLGLAHIRSDLSVSPWDPGCQGWVTSLALIGDIVYVAGNLVVCGGQPRGSLAAIDATSGSVTSWAPATNASAHALCAYGSKLYVGGQFSTIDGQPRNGLAIFDGPTGQLSPWNPAPNGQVQSFAPGGSVLYVGGSFSSIGGQPRSSLAAIDTASGAVTPWHPTPSGAVTALAVEGMTVYAGGGFTSVAGLTRNNLAALDASTGQVTPWNPNVNRQVKSIGVRAGTVYVAGWFDRVGGETRYYLAGIDAVSGVPNGWNPMANSTMEALAVDDSTVFAAGSCASVGGQTRNRLAAIDVRTGALLPWNPDADNVVFALALADSTIYAGGMLTNVGGQPRARVAAIDAHSGTVRDWTAHVTNSNNLVYALLARGSTVYVGGYFTSIGGQPRNHLAAVDATSGAVTPWNPDLHSTVTMLAPLGPRLVVGGSYLFAALDTATALLTPWVSLSGSAGCFGVHDGMAYIGGRFGSIDGVPRESVARMDAATGSIDPWDPNCLGSEMVNAIAVVGNTVVLGGDFDWIGGQLQDHLAAADVTTGALLPWKPNPDWPVFSLVVWGTTMIVGGEFYFIADTPHSRLAAFDFAPTASAGPTPGDPHPLRSVPNPFSARTRIRFDVSDRREVSLGVYDLSGRQVASLLDRQRLEPGPHEVEFDGRGLRAGLYFCRLTTGSIAQTAKILHVD